MRVQYLPEFWLDVETSRQWYDEQRPGLGREFVRAVLRAIDDIQDGPEAFRIVEANRRRLIIK
jgi:hypothetical protein